MLMVVKTSSRADENVEHNCRVFLKSRASAHLECVISSCVSSELRKVHCSLSAAARRRQAFL